VDGREVVHEENAEATQQANLEQLRSHLKEGSLAEKLVLARIGTAAADPRPALRKVVLDRIEELKRGYEPVSDNNA
jgi:hypothetical protein